MEFIIYRMVFHILAKELEGAVNTIVDTIDTVIVKPIENVVPVILTPIGDVASAILMPILMPFNLHYQEMYTIIKLRDEKLEKLRCIENEKDLHRHKEIQEVFKLFKMEVEHARKLLEEAEYTTDNGEKIKGFQGKHLSIY